MILQPRNKPKKLFALFILTSVLLSPVSGVAQEQEGATYLEKPVVKLQSLDKVTARTVTFEANIGATVKFGPLYIKAQTCREAPPVEQPESAAFLQIWEISKENEPEWVFSGWMFASSPGLSSMDHPVYDVWVLDCLDEKTVQTEEEKQAQEERGEGELEEENVPEAPEENQ